MDSKYVLKNVDITCSRGRPIVILGASGSGETSLVEIIAGLSCPDAGTCNAIFESGRAAPMNEINVIGFVTQNYYC